MYILLKIAESRSPDPISVFINFKSGLDDEIAKSKMFKTWFPISAIDGIHMFLWGV